MAHSFGCALFLIEKGGFNIIRCFNKVCIYNEKEECNNPNERYIDEMGACSECVMSDFDEELIKDEKQKARARVKKPDGFDEYFKKDKIEFMIKHTEKYLNELKKELHKI